MVFESRSFVMGDGMVVVFTRNEQSGIVGEDYEWTEAHGFFPMKPEAGVCRIAHSVLRKHYYQQVQGKEERIDFWKWMKSMSPEVRAEEAERSNRQALALVE